MKNVCRLTPEEMAQFRQELAPEMAELISVLGRIEQKVGTEDSWRRTSAISQALLLVSSSFQNVLVSMAGWADQYPEGVKIHSASTSAGMFTLADQDDALLEIMNLVVKLLAEEKAALLKNVQEDRTQRVSRLH